MDFRETKLKGHGSGFLRQERSGSDENEFSTPKTMPLLRSNSLSGEMLSFSSIKSEVYLPSKQGTASSSYYHHVPVLYNSRNAGVGSGSLNHNMHGPFPGVRGPFTPSQWIELEHQALIYKYINANVPIPSNLIIPIKKAFTPFGSYGGSFPPNSLGGWSSYHLGFVGNNDPEPGRCRRTDGKKWRCSKDAVLDQKYCERHINRGRHRSRKPVEGQTGHALSAGTTTTSKVASLSSSMPITNGSSVSNSLATTQQHQLKNLHANPSSSSLANRNEDRHGHSTYSSTISMKSIDGPDSNLKRHNPFEYQTPSEFGFVSSDSLLNPSKKSFYANPKNYDSFQHSSPLVQFTEEWPKDESDRSGMPWSEDLKSDWTQLSMSIPMTSSGLSSSASSPGREKLALSPIQMGLGVCGDLSWGSSSSSPLVGGPLGEVLNSTKSSPVLDFMNVGWDGISAQMESSPTGVLQKATFASFSNSSTSGSSPREEHKMIHERVTLCNDMLGSTIATSASIPSI